MPNSPLDRLGGVTLTQLAYAVAVDTHRHFGSAAAACHVTQPTLSMQLRKLERTLGARLFDRTRSPVVPTDAGRAVVAQARVVLREAARLATAVDAADAESLAGEVRLGVIPTLAPYLIPAVVAALAERHPRLELVVEEALTDDVVARVAGGTLALGLVASPVAMPELNDRLLFREPFVGYVSEGHRLAASERLRADDLRLDDLWLLAEGHCLRVQSLALCRQRAAPARRRDTGDAASPAALRARFESGNVETLKRLVERGMGMTLLPALAVADLASEAQRALVRPFAAPAPSRDVRAIHRRAQAGDRRLEAVLDVLAEVGRVRLAAATPDADGDGG